MNVGITLLFLRNSVEDGDGGILYRWHLFREVAAMEVSTEAAYQDSLQAKSWFTVKVEAPT